MKPTNYHRLSMIITKIMIVFTLVFTLYDIWSYGQEDSLGWRIYYGSFACLMATLFAWNLWFYFNVLRKK